MHDNHSPDDHPVRGFPPDISVDDGHADDGLHRGDLAGVDVRDWCTALETMPPGLGLARALSDVDMLGLSAYELVVVVQAWERQKAYVSACQFEAMARLVDDRVYQRCSQQGPAYADTDGVDADFRHAHRAVDPCGDELSLALAWSPGRAKSLLVTAIELVQELPDTLSALKTGRVDADKARLIAERTRCLTVGDQRHQVEVEALAAASRKTRTQLDQVLRRAVIAADPAGAEQRRANAAEERRISAPQPSSPGGEDGMAYVGVYGPAEDVTALYTAVDAAARFTRAAGDRRTLEQLRFDTLTGLGWSGLDNGHLGCCNPACVMAVTHGVTAAREATTDHQYGAKASHGAGHSLGADPSHGVDHGRGADHGHIVRRERTPSGGTGPRILGRRHRKAATVNVTVAASTLFGSDEQPGWLDGFGPITAQAARRMSGEGPWRRLLTDPASGEVLEYGRTTYAPPARLAAHIVARDRTCRFPTCTYPAHDSDIDHRVPYTHSGTTGATNCWTLHRQHHVGKTIHRYRTHTDTHGTIWWTTPAGHHYPVHPEAIGPIMTSREAGVPSHSTSPIVPTARTTPTGLLGPTSSAKAAEPVRQIDHDPPPF